MTNTMKMKADPKAIHICNSLEPTLNQKLQKSMSCQRTVSNENCSKFEREINVNETMPVPNNVYKK